MMTEPLTSFTKDEWREVALVVAPELSDEEFDEMWADFQAMKARKRLN